MSTDSGYIPGANKGANEQVRTYEATDGAQAWDMRGVPVVILTTRGRKSGALRKAPLMRVTDGEKYAVVASLGGAPEHPVWYLNLLADPVVTLQDKAVKSSTGRAPRAARSASNGGRGQRRSGRITTTTKPRPIGRSRS